MNKYFEQALETVQKIAARPDRTEEQELRRKHLASFNAPMTKVAFDTRLINSETAYIPRRNLQNYHRSDPFIDEKTAGTIKTFFKLKTAVDSVKSDFTGDPDWHDSYCRILSEALDRTLRVEQKDMNFFRPQMEYLQELLYLRYRLKTDDIERHSEHELRNLVIDRDEKLLHKAIYAKYVPNGMTKNSEGQAMMAKNTSADFLRDLLGEVKANKDNRNVERSITITIKDSVKDDEPLEKSG